jgi:hypothetical protein
MQGGSMKSQYLYYLGEARQRCNVDGMYWVKGMTGRVARAREKDDGRVG